MVLPALVMVIAWLLNRRYWKRAEARLALCESTAIHKRAVKMNNAVGAKIKAQDSRSDASGAK